MSLKIKYGDNNRAILTFDNVISIWSILKFLSSSAFLKHYVIENYEGGNTMVPLEAWNEEGILYQELSPGVFLFPYESIGFVLNDSLAGIDIYVLDNPAMANVFQNNAELRFSIRNTDLAVLDITGDRVYTAISLYLLSIMKLGYDGTLLKSMEKVLKGLLSNREAVIEYVDGTLMMKPRSMSFIVSILESPSSQENSFYRIDLSQGKATRSQVKEKEIFSLGYYKKKILSKHWVLPWVFRGLVLALIAVLLLVFKKFALFLGIAAIAAYIVYRLVKHWIYRFYRSRGVIGDS